MKKAIIFLFYIAIFNRSFSQVNLQTGAAEASIPLYSYSDPVNRLGTGVSLDYISGNGLKVSSIASSVGTGWSLNCGGYIQRIQNGEPDDQKNNDTYTYPTSMPLSSSDFFWTTWSRNYYPNGYLYSEFSPSDQIPNSGVYTPVVSPAYWYYKPHPKFQADREQDIFKFSFNGREGYFVISRKNSNGVSEIRTLYDSKLKIEKVDGDLNNTQNIRTTISQFIITDENGIRYLFSEGELDQVCEYNYNSYMILGGDASFFSAYPIPTTNPMAQTSMPVKRGSARNSFVKNKWYLAEIINPLTNKKIQFQYESYNVDIEAGKVLKLASYNSSTSKVNITIERLKGISKRLKKIILSEKESVILEYSYVNRVDASYDKSLSNLIVVYNNELKYKWNFEYGYFVKNSIKPPDYSFTTEDITWSRLCLLKLTKMAPYSISEPPYSFAYYMGNENGLNSAIPPMFSVQQDLRGYYSTFAYGYYNPANGTVSPSNAPYEPNRDALFPLSFYSGMLRWLYYDAYITYSKMLPTIEARNGILKGIQNPLGGSLEFSYEQNREGGYASQYYYGVRVNKITEFDGVDHANDKITEYKYIKEDGSPSAWGHEYCVNNQTTPVTMSDCGQDYRPANNPNSMVRSMASYVFSNGFSAKAFASTVKIGGMSVPSVVIVVLVNVILSLFDEWFGSSSSGYEDFNVVEYNSTTINNGNYLPFQYSRVEVINKVGAGNNGKTAYEFTTSSASSAYAIDVPTLSAPYANKQRYAYWIYGLPQKISVYDKDNKLLKQTVNTYNPIKTVLNNDLYKSQKWAPVKYVYACGFNAQSSEQTQYDKVVSDIYYPITGRIELTETKEYTYNNTDYSLVTTNYEYSTDNYQVKKITTTNSRGELVEVNTYYPTDYSLTGTIQTMKDNNMLNVPVSTQTFITKGGNSYLLNGSVNEFSSIPGGDIRTIKTYSFQNTAPVVKSSVLFSGSQLVPNMQYYKQNQTIAYGTSGFPDQISVLNGSEVQMLVSKIYDYGNKLLVAEIDNATLDDVAYTSFEAEGKGG